jgi:hypothetical protein
MWKAYLSCEQVTLRQDSIRTSAPEQLLVNLVNPPSFSSNSSCSLKQWQVKITNNVPVVYMAPDVTILMQAVSIVREIGRSGPLN